MLNTKISGLIFTTLLALSSPIWSGQALTIVHFNDFHGQLEPYDDKDRGIKAGGIARIAAVLEDIRAEDPARPLLVLFAGDLLQGTTTSTLFLGRPDTKLLGDLGVDAAVIGNHEVDFGQDNLRKLIWMADYPMLAANLTAEPEPLPLLPSVVLQPGGGLKISVLGLTTDELVTATHPRNAVGLKTQDPIAVAQKLTPNLDAKSDVLIVLSHLGFAGDKQLAQQVPGVDLVIGGHNHLRFDQPQMENGVPIVQAGERGAYLGRLDAEVEDDHLIVKNYQLIPINDSIKEDDRIARKVAKLVTRADQELLTVVGTAKTELSARREVMRRTEAAFGDFVADLAREFSGAQIALFNGGGFRADIPAGEVRLKEIFQAFPFRNELVTGKLSGAEIQAALDHSASLPPEDNPGGFLQVSGLRFKIANGKALDVQVDGKPLDPAATYSLVVPDFLSAGGDGYAVIAGMRDQVNTGQLISAMLVDAFRAKPELEAVTDGRILREAAP